MVLFRSKELCYPYIFEAEPGVLWVTTFQFPAKAKVMEKDLLK